MQAQQELMIQSNLPRRFLVVSNKGMFRRTFDNLNGDSEMQIAAAGEGYNSTNRMSIITTTTEGAEQVSKS